MRGTTRSAACPVALAAAIAVALGACAPSPDAAPNPSRESSSGGEEQTGDPVTWPQGAPPADRVTCPEATLTVSTADELRDALVSPAPGTVISLEPGTYEGEFTATGRATADEPVFVCGGADAVLRGEGPKKKGTVLALDGVEHWNLVGFTVRSGQKGIMADGITSTVLQGLTVTDIGDEAIHLRSDSTKNLVLDNTVSDTGQRKKKFGEGVYVGTAESNWCDVTGCDPDRSDHNVVAGNDMSETTAESVDVKEGTTGGVVADNVFDGSSLSGADSWVDVKGNGWLVQANRGTSSPEAGFQTHDVVAGWGTDNVFDANRADVGGPGYGFELRPVADNRVTCTNVVENAEEGMSNADCG